MIPVPVSVLAAVTHGRLAGGLTPTSVVDGPVEFDSRRIKPGGLFAALSGSHVDGHDYVSAAIDAGAAAGLVAREVNVPAIVVSDVIEALGKIARYVVDQLPELTIVGVTGSSGKTSTKDLIAFVLSSVGPTVATIASHNNEFSHPATVLRSTVDTKFLVVEKGARGKGHIAYLAGIAPPDIAVVLNVGMAHVGEFGSLESTAEAKGELVEALSDTGTAILNADDPLVAAMGERTQARVVRFGVAEHADVRATAVELDENGCPRFTVISRLEKQEQKVNVHLRLVGEHHVSNALAAMAVGLVAGADINHVAARLNDAESMSPGRMEVHQRPDGITIINDAYNANPDSMRAGLRALRAVATAQGKPRRTWAVIGHMAELGDASRKAHEEIGRYAATLNIDQLVLVGEEASVAGLGARAVPLWSGNVVEVPDKHSVLEFLEPQLEPGDVVFVKASLSAGLQAIARSLYGENTARVGLGEGPAV